MKTGDENGGFPLCKATYAKLCCTKALPRHVHNIGQNKLRRNEKYIKRKTKANVILKLKFGFIITICVAGIARIESKAEGIRNLIRQNIRPQKQLLCNALYFPMHLATRNYIGNGFHSVLDNTPPISSD
uniref:Uncharacterized protein n=1 Tax=Glossina austeni TaxID=7395 RepID=A0A1A9V5J7_GLOAU